MEFGDILTAVGIGALLGISAVGLYIWFLYQRLKTKINQMIEEVVAEAESNLVGLDIEVDRDTYFAYNTEDNQFVCQGSTVVEIAQAFRDRFPGKTAYLAKGEPDVLAKFREELLNLKLDVDENNT